MDETETIAAPAGGEALPCLVAEGGGALRRLVLTEAGLAATASRAAQDRALGRLLADAGRDIAARDPHLGALFWPEARR